MTTVLLFTLGVLLFTVGLGVSIALHECGHMLPAKRFGVRVPHFFVGFGKTVWSRRRGETEYGVKAFPLGGFVKLVGMIPPDPDPRPLEERGRQGFLKQLVFDVRNAEQQLVQPGDEGRLFYKLPWWQKIVVMAGGPMVNVVIAFFLFGAVFALQGVPEPTTTVSKVSECVIAVRVGEEPRACEDGDPVAPAKQAGLLPGDRILAANGETVEGYDELRQIIRANGAGELSLLVERDGAERELVANTRINDLPSLDPDAQRDLVRAGFLGITPVEVRESKGLLYTADFMVDSTVQTVQALAKMPPRLWGVVKTVAGLQERQQDSPMSVVGAGRVAGEITSDTERSWLDRLASLAVWLAAVNLFLGVFNFVPLPPLDGGHIAGALYEAARRGVARLFGRPDPGYFDVARLLPVAYVMVGVFLVMTVLLVYADLVKPVPL